MMAAAFRPAVFQSWTLSGPVRPVRRPLGQMPAPKLPEARLAAIRKAADAAIEALQLEIGAVGAEIDWTSPSALRVEPDKYRQIGKIGADFSPYEIRSVIMASARGLGDLASRMLAPTAALSHYLTPEQAAALNAAAADAAKAVRYEQDLDREDVRPEHMAAAEDHVQSHLRNVKPYVEAAERSVVEGEAPFVQVREPGEKGVTPAQIAVGAGALALVGFVLWQIFG